MFNLVYVCITLLEFSSVNLKRKSFCDFVVDKSKLRMKGLKPPLRDLFISFGAAASVQDVEIQIRSSKLVFFNIVVSSQLSLVQDKEISDSETSVGCIFGWAYTTELT